ncbi:MAG TPA: ester cyclase [Thermoleophilaceae bacterium]|nr:ester cyclase [Thermoleophilaceae bacterium]
MSSSSRSVPGARAPDPIDLRERRLAIVREHMDSENTHDFDATMATFDHPRYEIVPTGDVYDGPEEVATYFETTRTAFPDQRNQNATLRVADDAIIAEFDLLGTHQGELRGIPATGRSFRCRVCAIFEFADDSDHIICERVYFDQATIAQQLLGEGGAGEGAVS